MMTIDIKTAGAPGDVCPVCGCEELGQTDAYRPCPVCGWINDPVQNKAPGQWGGANLLSANEARLERMLLSSPAAATPAAAARLSYRERYDALRRAGHDRKQLAAELAALHGEYLALLKGYAENI